MAHDVHGAFHEVEAQARGTRCRKFLFSLSISPPQGADISTQGFEQAIDKAERRLGLSGQPRVIVFHEKGDGRDRHVHAVWSRIDGEAMKAIPMDFHKLRQREISKELFIEHGLEVPRGLIDSKNRNPLNYDFDQYQHAKRLGKNAHEIKAAFVDAWSSSDDKRSFAHALQAQGYRLARGDRRGYLAVDHDGKEFNLKKWLGVKTRAVRDRLGPEQDLPSLNQTKAEIAADMLGKVSEYDQEVEQRRAEQAKRALQQRQMIVERQRRERTTTLKIMKERQAQEGLARQNKFRKGLGGIWDRLRGEHKRIQAENEVDAKACQQRDQAEKDRIIAQQRRERCTWRDRVRVHHEQIVAQKRDLKTAREQFMEMRMQSQQAAPERMRQRRRSRSRDGPELGH
ncbi:MAG: relaxase [Pseudomonadota bacterium]